MQSYAGYYKVMQKTLNRDGQFFMKGDNLRFGQQLNDF